MCPHCHGPDLGLTSKGRTVPVLECLDCGYCEQTSLADRWLLGEWEGRCNPAGLGPSSAGPRPDMVDPRSGALLTRVAVEPRSAEPCIRPDLRLRYGRALQRCVGDELRMDRGAVDSWRRYVAEGFRSERLWDLHRRGQLSASSQRRHALAYTYFLQWRHVRQSAWALRRLVEQHPVLGSETLRVLSLGGGPLSDAIALSMVLAEVRPGQRAECLTVEHNADVLAVGDALLRETGAVEFVESNPFGSAADPRLWERLQEGRETGSPFLVITNHVFHQGTVTDRTLQLWASLIEMGTASEAWFLSVEAWPTRDNLAALLAQGKNDWLGWTRFYGFGRRALVLDYLVGAGLAVDEKEDCTEMSIENANLEPIDGDMWRRSGSRMAFSSRTSYLRRR